MENNEDHFHPPRRRSLSQPRRAADRLREGHQPARRRACDRHLLGRRQADGGRALGRARPGADPPARSRAGAGALSLLDRALHAAGRRLRSGRLRRALGLHRFDEQGVERLGVLGGAQLVDQPAVAQQARDARQRLEMIGAGAFGRRRAGTRCRSAARRSHRNRSDAPAARTGRPAWRATACGACGMAMPPPMPVEPRRSRSSRRSNRRRSSSLNTVAARAANSANRAFLPDAFTLARTASGPGSKSAISTSAPMS